MKTYKIYVKDQDRTHLGKGNILHKLFNWGISDTNIKSHSQVDIDIEDIIFIKEGFSIMAYLFHFFWFLYYKVWLSAILLFIYFVALGILEFQAIISYGSAVIMQVGILILIAFEAADLHALSLEKKGYILQDIIVAKNLNDAKHRFFDQNFVEYEETDMNANINATSIDVDSTNTYGGQNKDINQGDIDNDKKEDDNIWK